MYIVQMLLPLQGQDGERLPQELFDAVRAELVARFGGLTAYSRSPARGLWVDEEQPGAPVERDDVVVYEVLVEALDRGWWSGFRADLCGRLRQKELLVRAHAVELL